jgi:ribosomal protein L34E
MVMCGVVDEQGQQWERCNECGKWVRIQNLCYEQPSENHPYGRDLCTKCFKQSKGEQDANQS